MSVCPKCGHDTEPKRSSIPTLMFSESARLLCEHKGNQYWVVNGHWYGTRKGKMLFIHVTGSTIRVDDWQELTRDEFNEAYPHFGY